MSLLADRDHTFVPRPRSIEDRRARGEIACAECRRLKLKCDRVIPCSSCAKRGCAELCPNATNITTDTTRTVVATSQHLHDEMASLRRRARALELALGALHFKREGFAHPLLGQDDSCEGDNDGPYDDIRIDKLTKHVGMLHLSENDGMQRFFGNVDHPQKESKAIGPVKPVQLPPVLERCIRSFPFPMPSGTREQAVQVLRRHLPNRAYVEQTLHSVVNNLLFMIPAVDNTLIFVELLPGLYDARLALPPSTLSDREEGVSPRAFALLYALLANGALLNVDDPDRELHSTTFGRLCLAGLGAVSIFEKPSYIAVLALFVHSTYHLRCQKELGDIGRCFNNLALQVAVQMGLFLDPSHWGLSWLAIQRRRRLFWALFQVNTWECISTGRPPAIHDSTIIDCQFPLDETTERDVDGPKLAPDVPRFKRARDLVFRVVLLTNAVELPQYHEIMDADSAIRAEWVPPSTVHSNQDAQIVGLNRAFIVIPLRAMVLLSLHRGHFVQAIEDSPNDPAQSPYRTSFLTSVCSAWEILDWMPKFFEVDPSRAVYVLCPAWTWGLAAAVLLYTIVEKAPDSECVHTILEQLERVCAVFAAATALGGGHASSGLPTLQRLCELSKIIIAGRGMQLNRVAWSVEPSKAWSADAKTSAPGYVSSARYSWLDDDMSNSFKSLFKHHYRDAQQSNTPSTTPMYTPSPTPPPVPAVSNAYPGYLQHSVSRLGKSKRARENNPASIRLPELLPAKLLADDAVDHHQAFLPPTADMQLSYEPGDLTSIWLVHTRKLGVLAQPAKHTASRNVSTSLFFFDDKV